MKKKLFLTLSCLTYTFFLLGKEKVLIITSAYNRADFVEWQYKTFDKFLKDDYEFVVFNDASDPEHKTEIEDICKQYAIKCINIPQEIHNLPYLERWPGEDLNHPSVRNCNVVQYALDTIGYDHDGIVAIFDSDLFLVKEASFNEWLRDYDIFAFQQSKGSNEKNISYFWIGICIMNMKNLTNKRTLNFNCGRVFDIPVDSGGHTHYYLINEKPNVFFMDQYGIQCDYNMIHIDSAQKQLLKSGISSGEFYHKAYFFHYHGGTNWDWKPDAFHRSKSELVKEYINTILENQNEY